MVNQVLQLWERVLTDNVDNLAALYDSLTPFLIIFIGTGATAAVSAIIIEIFRGK